MFKLNTYNITQFIFKMLYFYWNLNYYTESLHVYELALVSDTTVAQYRL